MTDLPLQQRASVREGEGYGSKARVKTIGVSQPGPGQILVKINWSGLCASDKSLLLDEWAGFGIKMTEEKTRGIAGHEGAGIVVAVADDVKNIWKAGDRAGIKWVASVCRECEFCTNGSDELHCPKQLNSGFTTPGTFQEYCLTDARYATRLPAGVLDEEAGPIMCGGVTAYTACKRSAVRPGQWIVVLGAGGGLGHFGVQYAKAMGMRVIAVDGGEEKAKLCKQLGAEQYVDFTQVQDIPAKVLEITTYGAHGVIVFAAAKASYGIAGHLLRPGGTVVAVALPISPEVMCGASPMLMVSKRLNFVGSETGTLKEVEEALDFCARDLVHPVLSKGSLEDVDKFCKLMMEGKLAGRAVLKVAA